MLRQLLFFVSTASGDLYHSVINAQHRGELVGLCNHLGLTNIAAEIGVFRGGFSRHNLVHWKGKKYFMIDAWDFRYNDTLEAGGEPSSDKNTNISRYNDRNYNLALAAVEEWRPPKGDRAVVMRRFSESVAQEFPNNHFDFIYIDAGHEYRNVLRDARMWWPKLKSGGMLAGDDFADMTDTLPKLNIHSGAGFGVKSAVAKFAREVGSPFFLTFADHDHNPTEYNPRSGSEFARERHDPSTKSLPNLKELPPPEDRVRSQRFYPAWYMFK